MPQLWDELRGRYNASIQCGNLSGSIANHPTQEALPRALKIMSDTSRANPQISSERRFYPRQRVLYSCVQLANENGGIILNISENGLAMRAVRTVADPSPHMRFQFTHSGAWIETQGNIVWLSRSEKTAGVEFINLPDKARDQIKQWIIETELLEEVRGERQPSIAATTAAVLGSETQNGVSIDTTAREGRLPSSENNSCIPVPPLDLHYQQPSFSAPMFDHNQTNTSHLWSRSLVVGLIAIFLAFFIAYRLQRTRRVQSRTAVTTTSTPQQVPAPNVLPRQLAPPTSSDDSGFALQVGAMLHKENADALVASLRGSNFPAFESLHQTRQLYLVLVGPYTDSNSISEVKQELEKQGLKPIPIRWNPKSNLATGARPAAERQ